jgi:hypothetical protein
MRRIGLMALFSALLLSVTAVITAQSGGQVCVRLFDDTNRNGLRDQGELLITSGNLSASLSDASGTVIASTLLANAPTATQGLICFQYLADGDYAVTVVSADYLPITPNTFTAQVSGAGLPVVVEFGGAINAPVAPSAGRTGLNSILTRPMLERLAASGIGALVIMALAALMGMMVYFSGLRPRLRRIIAEAKANPTGVYPKAN